MYQSLLVLRFLTTRIMPVIAVLAVALCVTLVIVVVSVMTGFLDMLKSSGRTLVGDVVVSYETTGIPYYREFIAEVERLPEAAAATPVIETFGLLRMPYGPAGSKTIETVQVWGVEPATLDAVIDFRKTMYWKAPDERSIATMGEDDPRRDPNYDRLADAMAMRREPGVSAAAAPSPLPGLILGMEISHFNHRQRDGSYRTNQRYDSSQDRAAWMPQYEVSLTLVPVNEGGTLDVQRRQAFSIVNEFQSGVYQIDKNRVMIPFAEAQELLRLSERPLFDPKALDDEGNPVRIGVAPARATTILIKAKPGVTPEALRDAVKDLYVRFAQAKSEDPNARALMPNFVDIKTWEERLKDLIGPVENERGLMRILFSLVYVVCAGLVLAIFWSIVHEKTRDIGILRSVGAGRTGILTIFLAYGLTIGVVGSLVGLGLAWLVISNINEIHSAMGRPVPMWVWITTGAATSAFTVAAIAASLRGSVLYGLLWSIVGLILGGLTALLVFHRGFTIWDPSVYYFSTIPNQLDFTNAIQTMAFATIFSVFGAAVPAAKAADTDPVRSLRYE